MWNSWNRLDLEPDSGNHQKFGEMRMVTVEPWSSLEKIIPSHFLLILLLTSKTLKFMLYMWGDLKVAAATFMSLHIEEEETALST